MVHNANASTHQLMPKKGVSIAATIQITMKYRVHHLPYSHEYADFSGFHRWKTLLVLIVI